MASIRDIRETLEDGAAKVRENAEELRDRMGRVAGDIRDRGEDAWDDFRKLVRKHPGETITAALLLGAAIGVLLGGRRRD
jgi:ElaB/YqjD/DUF883 family membrane-anchored ribosome-binding protein